MSPYLNKTLISIYTVSIISLWGNIKIGYSGICGTASVYETLHPRDVKPILRDTRM